MKRGIIVSSALLVFAVAVLLASFVFVLTENELHNSAMAGLIVEKSRWVGEADDYYCKQDVLDTSDWGDAYNSHGEEEFFQADSGFKENYTRIGEMASFVSEPGKMESLDLFYQEVGSFSVDYVKNYRPQVAIADPESGELIDVSGSPIYSFNYDVCDPESEINNLLCTLESGPNGGGGPWATLPDSGATPIQDVQCTGSQSFQVDLSGLATNVKYCFKLTVKDNGSPQLEGSAMVCDVNVSSGGCTTAADCGDGNPCTDNQCNAGVCEFPNLNDGDTPAGCASPNACCGGVCASLGDGIECINDGDCPASPSPDCTEYVCADNDTPGNPCDDACVLMDVACGNGVIDYDCGEICDPLAFPSGCDGLQICVGCTECMEFCQFPCDGLCCPGSAKCCACGGCYVCGGIKPC